MVFELCKGFAVLRISVEIEIWRHVIKLFITFVRIFVFERGVDHVVLNSVFLAFWTKHYSYRTLLSINSKGELRWRVKTLQIQFQWLTMSKSIYFGGLGGQYVFQ